MALIAQKRNNSMSRFHNALYFGDIEQQIAALREFGMSPLDHATAKTNGLDDLAAEIASASGMDDQELQELELSGKLGISASNNPLGPPETATRGCEHNWAILGEVDNSFACKCSGRCSCRQLRHGDDIADTTSSCDSIRRAPTRLLGDLHL
ncbi:hypothetical protein CF319_g9631 [Tilletia indica]|nr:hypothetical protein CF319_g9631 [Tilletia indica]